MCIRDRAQLPWWVSVCLSVVAYVVLRFVVPSIQYEDPILKGMAGIARPFALVAALCFLFPAVLSAARSLRRRNLLSRQSGLESIRSLSWKEFEELLAEAYRRQGYLVGENTSLGPDGGVDLRIERGGDLYLVQCKQWRDYKVGVKVVREIYGLVTAENASGAIIVTSGLFTQEAKNFAADKPLGLVEGSQLADLVRNVQAVPRSEARVDPPRPGKRCPQCGGTLVLRQAKRGKHAGSKFWGCSGFPDCQYKEEYTG